MQRKDISLRGSTYAALKAKAAAMGIKASALAEEWLLEYAPFTDVVPTPLERVEPGKNKGFVRTVVAQHPVDPPDPPPREPQEKQKPLFQPTVTVEPAQKPPPSGGGYVEF